MRAEWRYLSGDVFIHPRNYLHFQVKQHFMKYHQIWNYACFRVSLGFAKRKTFDVRGFCAEAIKCKPWRVWVTGYKPHTPPTHFVSRGSGNHAWKWNDWWACYSPFLHNVFRKLSVMAFSSFHPDSELPHMTFQCNIWTSLSHSLCFGKVLYLFKRLLKTSKRYAAQDTETRYIDLVIKRIPGCFQYSSSLHSISRFFE